MTIRVRFAPSPTGFLHVGGARTALFNWLWARKTGGVFVLRIEDTDQERSSDEMTKTILRAMRWLGLDWDEGPYFQSQGLARHQADAKELLKRGLAYRDFSTPEQTASDRAAVATAGRGFRPARERADSMSQGEVEARLEGMEPYAIRFRVPEGETVWDDIVHGETRFSNQDIDDLAILRSDGTPTYNLAVVSDDAHMGITHVIRGDDHLSNTPKQILLYQALRRPVPVFGHVPLILGPDGRRLSKRHGATSIAEYEARGFLPAAMVNFLALLGWSPGDDQEVLELGEIVERFTLDRILKKSSVFDLEKLLWLNGRHLAGMPAEELEALVSDRFQQRGLADAESLTGRREWFRSLIDLLKTRSRSVDDIVDKALPFLRGRVEYDQNAVRKHWRDPEGTAEHLHALRQRLAEVCWSEDGLERALRGLASERGVGAGKLIHPLRVALTGQESSPGIFEVMILLGRDTVLGRIDEAVRELGSASV